MSRYLLLLPLLLLLALPAAAQNVPSPATAPIPTNAALKAAPGNPQGAIRQGFAAAGDGGYARYTWLSGNCTAADDGAQVQPTGTGCWVLDPGTTPGKASVRIWGARGDSSVDDAPAFRAACAYALSDAGNGTAIMVPAGRYTLNTPDPRGSGVLYLGTGADDGRACSLIGTESSMDYPSGASYGGPATLVLGSGLNRPLIYIPLWGASPHIRHLTLHGAKTTQAGWAGGPGGKLYVVQAQDADAGHASPETGPIFDDVVIEAGYNGNLYVGSYRYVWSNRLWSAYSGQGPADCSVWHESNDSIHYLPAIGSNTGCGMYFSGGAQHQIHGGAIWSNTASGVMVGGLQVNYLAITSTNIQYNDVGIYNTNWAPYPGGSASGITCTGCAFDGNATSDVKIAAGSQTNRQMKLVAPMFVGNAAAATPKPAYNIEVVGGTAVVDVVGPAMGAAPFTTAFTNAPDNVFCSGSQCPSTAFLPTLGNGTPTYVLRQGHILRYGKLLHLTALISVSALGGPTGNMTIGGIPYSDPALTNYISPCSIGAFSGWTGGGGRNVLGAQVGGALNYIGLFESGSGLAYQASPVASWAAATTIAVSCTYIPAS